MLFILPSDQQLAMGAFCVLRIVFLEGRSYLSFGLGRNRVEGDFSHSKSVAGV